MYKFIKRSCVAATLILAFVVTLASPLTVFAAPSSSTGVLANSPQISPPNTFILSFDANGGSGTQAPIAVDINKPYQPLPSGSSLTITPPPGKEFLGWAVAPGYNPNWMPLHVHSDNSPAVDTTYYAVWGNTFTISFDANGGTGTQAPIAVDVNRSGQPLPPSQNPLTITPPAGKGFVGWALTPTGTPTYYNDPSIRVDTTYYAIWGDTVTISFDANGGTGTQASVTAAVGNISGLPHSGNTTLVAPAGKHFLRWSLTPDGSAVEGKSIADITEDTTLYAIWSTQVTLTFDANGGTGTQASRTALIGGPPNLPSDFVDASGTMSLTLTAPEGKLFSGWASTPTGQPGENMEVTGDMTFYAIWGEPVTLTFDFNGTTGTQPPITRGKGRVVYLNNFANNGLYVAPEGKTFGGWSLTVDGEAIIKYRFTEDATLYAVWEGGTPTPTPDIPYAPSGTVNTQGSTLPAGTALNTNTATDVQVASMINYAKNLQLRGAYAFISDITLLDANGNPVQPDGNTLIRIDIAGLTPQDKVIVVHEKSDGSFELITATVYDGYLTFKPTSFSLYGVLVEKGAGAATTTALSPQTGAVR